VRNVTMSEIIKYCVGNFVQKDNS